MPATCPPCCARGFSRPGSESLRIQRFLEAVPGRARYPYKRQIISLVSDCVYPRQMAALG
jgi:hypothetical protein